MPKAARNPVVLYALCALAFWSFPFGCMKAEVLDRVTSQTVYVPSYSRVLTQDEEGQPLASTLVVHNVDPEIAISVTSIAYFDQNGVLLRSFVTDPVPLAPFASTNAVVPLGSIGAGIGANFVVKWIATNPAVPPVVEAIMIGGEGTRGISFTSKGVVIAQTP